MGGRRENVISNTEWHKVERPSVDLPKTKLFNAIECSWAQEGGKANGSGLQRE